MSSAPRLPSGSGYRNPRGYIVLRRNGKRVFEHREVWEQAHGPIPEGGVIHHKDHNPANNSLENLELIDRNGTHLRVAHAADMKETGRRAGLSNKGKPKPPEQRAKMSAAAKGKPKPLDHPGVFREGHPYYPGRWAGK